MVDVNRLKKDGKTKYVKLLGKGILTLVTVDHLFWNLPFCRVKQSQAVRKKGNVTDEEWSTKWEEIVAEHDLPGACEQLASGWKDYFGYASRGGGQWCWHCVACLPHHCGLGHAVQARGSYDSRPARPSWQEGQEKLNHCTTKKQMGGCVHALFMQFMQLLC